jgi:hypothetical protein
MMFGSKVGFSTLPTSRRQKLQMYLLVVLKVDRFSRHINAHINVPRNQSEMQDLGRNGNGYSEEGSMGVAWERVRVNQ